MNARRGAPLIERLMDRVHPEPNSGCWLWTGGVNGNGYGLSFLPGGKMVTAHRAMLIAHGATLTSEDVVMHRCDMPGCVNPEHLQIGTQADNMRDMNAKNRHRPSHKIPPDWRERIRKDGGEVPARYLAWWFGVSRKTIDNIRANRSWRKEQ